jgi:hypothetical protein
MARQCGCDSLELGALLLPKNESIEGHQWSAIAYGNAFARMRTHAHPREASIDLPTLRLPADPANADHGVKSTPSNRAHAVLATEDAVSIRIKRVGTLIYQYAHFILLLPSPEVEPAYRVGVPTEIGISALQPYILRHH